MSELENLRAGDGEWPPAHHRARIEAQEDWQALYRNRRHEVVQRWSGELEPYSARQDRLVPFPAAKIAARTLAAFLFGEDPTLSHADPAVAASLDALSSVQNLPARLLEGAVTQAAQGEIYLRSGWDEDVSPWAILSTIPGRQVLPRFRFGMLVDAAIVTEWAPTVRGDATYWRLIEQHEPGTIRYALWKGNADRLGRQVPLDEHGATEHLTESTTADGLDGVVATEIDELLLTHVPLGRDAESPHGVSLFDGLESLILAMHRLYSQEQHDAELARRRIAVAMSYIGRDANGRPAFDRSVDLFPLTEDAMGAVGAEGKPVHPIEFSDDNVMRERIRGRFRDFLIACGIAPDTLDATEAGGAISGTSRKLAQAMTIQTTAMVGRYWQDALVRNLALALEVSRVKLGQDVPTLTELPTVTLADGLIDDPVELARIVADLDTAEALSTLTKVRMVHPEWSDDEVAEEVDRILEASPVPPPAPPVSPFLRPVADEPDADAVEG